MLHVEEEIEVFVAIIRAIAVAMVDDFIGSEPAPNPFLDDNSMFTNAPVSVRIRMIGCIEQPISVCHRDRFPLDTASRVPAAPCLTHG